MAKNSNLGAAKKAKNDEFYTQYEDIEREMNAYLEYDENVFRGKTVLLPCDDPEWSNFTKYFAQNFERFGLKKLISTSYAVESKNINLDWEPTLFETENPNYDIDKSKTHGKIFVWSSLFSLFIAMLALLVSRVALRFASLVLFVFFLEACDASKPPPIAAAAPIRAGMMDKGRTKTKTQKLKNLKTLIIVIISKENRIEK